ncbi:MULTISPECIES: SDR family oxidoreductase [Burkholderia cepacia complex]|uniref:SDR family oxidoreductase n=1 Tax=Burkholderia cepacia complex TaxID=87882 RepID=UPI001CF25AA3|nr:MULTISPECIES: SDR family oxidoreductase [Burkholderia cepacia complex]MCA8057361.1 SDR family oxidoreductase [Burkholderia cepacia]MDN7535186.1 SDR family oxidoreductase [Burkholderia orbicola]
MDKTFAGKRVVVIGGNSGIGLASAQAFAQSGAEIAIVGRSPQTLEAARGAIGGNTLALQADVSRVADIERIAHQLREQWGRVDILFANAGIGAFLPLEDVDEETWDLIHNTNLKGTFFTVQKLLPLMQRGASIVLCGSVGGIRSVPGALVYGASKAGVHHMGHTLAGELVGRGIRVNTLIPGPIDTPLPGRSLGVPAEAVAQVQEQLSNESPMKRMGTPREAAAAVLFLASPAASFITGTEIIVDGGIHGTK